MTGVPLFRIGSQVVAGVNVGKHRVRVYYLSGWSPWENVEWFPDVFKPMNRDAEDMLRIARGGR